MTRPPAIVVLSVLLALLLPASANTQADGADATSDVAVPPGTYTYDEAKQLGLITPNPEGLPICSLDYAWPGYSSESESEAAIKSSPDASVCRVDPKDVIYVIRDEPRQTERQAGSNYRYGGPVTTHFNFEGGRAAIEVGNPSVNSSSEFVYARTAALTSTCGSRVCNSLQVGWEESSATGNDQLISTVASYADESPAAEQQRFIHSISAWAISIRCVCAIVPILVST